MKNITKDHFSAHCEVGMEEGVRNKEKRNQGWPLGSFQTLARLAF